jgi:phi LC3 family holin
MELLKKILNTKLNFVVRLKNPWFWVGLAGVFLTALNITPEAVTSWSALEQAVNTALSNPAMIVAALVAVLGVVVDPTTEGVGDSKQALGYSEPKKQDDTESNV